MSLFKKATKSQSKLRLALFGPSGAGKTFTALRLAKGLGGKVAVIDSERGSASKYADRFEFDVCNLDGKTISDYLTVISEAGKAGYDVLIIDSISHAWQELLNHVEKLAQAKYKGNSWSAWSDGTPLQQQLVNAILTYPGHLIATMRSKTEWAIQQNEKGRNTPTRVGLSPEQGKGIEYEFDMLMELTVDHLATVIKDRTGKYQDAIINKPGEDLGRELGLWLVEGVAPINDERVETISPKQVARIESLLQGINNPEKIEKTKEWLKSGPSSKSAQVLINKLESEIGNVEPTQESADSQVVEKLF